MAGLIGGPGVEPHGRRRIFENLQKNSEEKCNKCIILAYFSKEFHKTYVNFSCVWTKTNSWEILRNFRKFSKIALEHFEKSIILAYV